MNAYCCFDKMIGRISIEFIEKKEYEKYNQKQTKWMSQKGVALQEILF